VNKTLPPQPWKPKIHIDVATHLKAKASKVLAAIQILISTGRRMSQIDGVVYDQDGTVVAVDNERVHPPPV
jgi:hypothetical protein